MPSYELTGPERVYPYVRDVNGQPLGAVQPGDVRMFDEAPDSWWVPVIPPSTSETAASGEGSEAAADAPAPDPDPEPAAAPAPAPVPPAVVPPAGTPFAVTTPQ